ncbi:MAG: protein TolQ [Bdellovibrionales bacterium]|nr:protein TolQ [Bdellovibrionales bacterium]
MNNASASLSAAASANSLSVWTLITDASPIVKLILLLLLFASVVTWAIILQKSKLLRSSISDNRKFVDSFWSSPSLDEIHGKMKDFEDSQIAKVFDAGFKELRKLPQERTSDGVPEVINIQRALIRSQSIEMERMEKYVDILASTASAAPFVGLFGTVWGIMSSFQNIGAMGSASLAVVAPGISEALIATAVGLAAAIPAAISYNWILTRIKRVSIDMDNFSQEFLNMVQRSLLSNKRGAHGHESQPAQ